MHLHIDDCEHDMLRLNCDHRCYEGCTVSACCKLGGLVPGPLDSSIAVSESGKIMLSEGQTN